MSKSLTVTKIILMNGYMGDLFYMIKISHKLYFQIISPTK